MASWCSRNFRWMSSMVDHFVFAEIGAGEGNRTLVFSLEGCCSTIELHPRWRCTNTPCRPPQPALPVAVGTSCGALHPPVRALTGADSPPILMFPSTQRKEVIQCLLPS